MARFTLPGSITLRALAAKILRHHARGEPMPPIYRVAETTTDKGERMIGRIRLDPTVEEYLTHPPQEIETIEITIPAVRE